MKRFFNGGKRRVTFDATLLIEELNNVPLNNGLVYVKWKLNSDIHVLEAASSECTSCVELDNHQAVWNESLRFKCELYVNKETGVLEPCLVRLSVRLEGRGGKDYTRLGAVQVNLAEFAGPVGNVRRFLLQESKVNSTLKLSVSMSLISGDPTFLVPSSDASALDPGTMMDPGADDAPLGDVADTTTLESLVVAGGAPGDGDLDDRLLSPGSSIHGSMGRSSAAVASIRERRSLREKLKKRPSLTGLAEHGWKVDGLESTREDPNDVLGDILPDARASSK